MSKKTKCWICDNNFDDGDLEAKDHCHVTGNYRTSAHRDCNIKGKVNHNFSACFTT